MLAYSCAALQLPSSQTGSASSLVSRLTACFADLQSEVDTESVGHVLCKKADELDAVAIVMASHNKVKLGTVHLEYWYQVSIAVLATLAPHTCMAIASSLSSLDILALHIDLPSQACAHCQESQTCCSLCLLRLSNSTHTPSIYTSTSGFVHCVPAILCKPNCRLSVP